MRRMMGWLGAWVLAGCASVTPVVEVVTPVVDDPAGEPEADAPDEVMAPCLAVDEMASVATTWLDGTRLELCAGYEPIRCVGLDVATGGWEQLENPGEADWATRKSPSDVQSLDPQAITAAGGVHELCAPGGGKCHNVKLGKGRAVSRSFSGDGTMAVYTMHVGSVEMDFPDTLAFLVFDTAKGKLLKKHTYRDENFRCGQARFVDNWLLVAADVCAGPGGIAWLMDAKTGRKAADIGGTEGFGNYEPQVHRTADAIAVLEQTGTRFAVHDRKTGAFQRIVEVAPGEMFDTDPYGNALWTLPNGDLLVVLTGMSTGTVLRVDGATLGLKQRYEIARCPMP